jgi:FAD/FMN-containing dehydrogenase
LLIGSEGTLGIVTAATLRLVPAVAARAVIWAGVPSIAAARELLLHCQASEDEALEGFEVMPGHCLANVVAFLPGARAPLAGEHAWHALIELDAGANDADGLAERAEAMIAAAFERGLVEDATIAASEAQADAFWALRENIAPAERAAGPAVQHDVSVPLESVPGFVADAVAAVETRWPRTRAVAFGHLGDGNIHFHVIAPSGARADWPETEGKAVSRFVHDLVAKWRGSISAEHGIGQLKLAEFARTADPARLSTLRAVKQALDPAGIMNPGKLVPLAPPDARP